MAISDLGEGEQEGRNCDGCMQFPLSGPQRGVAALLVDL